MTQNSYKPKPTDIKGDTRTGSTNELFKQARFAGPSPGKVFKADFNTVVRFERRNKKPYSLIFWLDI